MMLLPRKFLVVLAFARKAKKHLGTSVSKRIESQRVYKKNGTLLMGMGIMMMLLLSLYPNMML